MNPATSKLYDQLSKAILDVELTDLPGKQKEQIVVDQILPILFDIVPGGFLAKPLFRLFAPFVARMIIRATIYAFNRLFGQNWIDKIDASEIDKE